MKAPLFILLLPRLVFAADSATPATPEPKPEYLKRLEEWTPDKSTPPPPIADPAGFFGLTGRVIVSDAKAYLDGGSIVVELRDEHKISLRIVKPAAWPGDPPTRSLVVVSFPGRLQGSYLLRQGGPEEAALLALTRKAIASTYAAGEPPPQSDHFFPFQAAARLTKILARHLHESQP